MPRFPGFPLDQSCPAADAAREPKDRESESRRGARENLQCHSRNIAFRLAVERGERGRAACLNGPLCLQASLIGDGGSSPVELRKVNGELLIKCLRLVLKEADRGRLP